MFFLVVQINCSGNSKKKKRSCLTDAAAERQKIKKIPYETTVRHEFGAFDSNPHGFTMVFIITHALYCPICLDIKRRQMKGPSPCRSEYWYAHTPTHTHRLMGKDEESYNIYGKRERAVFAEIDKVLSPCPHIQWCAPGHSIKVFLLPAAQPDTSRHSATKTSKPFGTASLTFIDTHTHSSIAPL